jgi:hypothetical protein
MVTGGSRRSVSHQAREVEMLNLASSYVRPLGLHPKAEYECAAAHCDKHFTGEMGCAFPATRKDGEVHMILLLQCLQAMPREACARA